MKFDAEQHLGICKFPSRKTSISWVKSLTSGKYLIGHDIPIHERPKASRRRLLLLISIALRVLEIVGRLTNVQIESIEEVAHIAHHPDTPPASFLSTNALNSTLAAGDILAGPVALSWPWRHEAAQYACRTRGYYCINDAKDGRSRYSLGLNNGGDRSDVPSRMCCLLDAILDRVAQGGRGGILSGAFCTSISKARGPKKERNTMDDIHTRKRGLVVTYLGCISRPRGLWE